MTRTSKTVFKYDFKKKYFDSVFEYYSSNCERKKISYTILITRPVLNLSNLAIKPVFKYIKIQKYTELQAAIGANRADLS